MSSSCGNSDVVILLLYVVVVCGCICFVANGLLRVTSVVLFVLGRGLFVRVVAAVACLFLHLFAIVVTIVVIFALVCSLCCDGT